MSTFKIGQRVKKVRGEYNIGLTGVIVAIGSYAPGLHEDGRQSTRDWTDIRVKSDRDWLNKDGKVRPQSVIAFSQSCDWEPIVDDGRKVMDWDAMGEMGLSPEHLLEVVKERVKEKA